MSLRCPNCGEVLPAGADSCTRCGAAISAGPRTATLSSNDKFLIFLGNVCLSPLLGAALYLVWKDAQPQKAQESCTLTWVAVALWVAFILGAIVVTLAVPSVANV